MKHTVIAAVLLLGLGTTVFAQETTKSTSTIPQKREEIKEKIEQKKMELQPQIEEKRQAIKEQILDKKSEKGTQLQILAQDRVSKILSHIFERFEAVLVKFDGIVLRINNRITKLQEQGVDVTESKRLLEEAIEHIEESASLIAASKIELQETLTTPTSKEDIKTTIEICKTSLKKTQQALVAVIGSLKASDGTGEELLAE